jgi:molybdate transport system regulatory protein
MTGFNRSDEGRIVSAAGEGDCLDSSQLNQLERSFREWARNSKRRDVRLSRMSVLLIFLLIRYTGAKLSEVLSIDAEKDLEWTRCLVRYRTVEAATLEPREVHISQSLAAEIRESVQTLQEHKHSARLLDLDPGFVRRKMYEQALACGFPKRLGGPEAIRKARGVELMRSNIPLPAVQMMLGHSTPNLTSSYVAFSKEEIQAVARRFLEKEAGRRTSARNSFFGKVAEIVKGDIQARVVMETLEGDRIATVITNDSLERLGLRPSRLITAEVKAPAVIVHGGDETLKCSAENRFKGVVTRITRGAINTECILKISATTELCAIISSMSATALALKAGDHMWALFNSSAVVLHVD